MPEMRSESPVASFEISPGCPSTSELVQLSDRSHDPGDAGIAWRVWDFGDGSNGVGSSPVHRYYIAGTYDVTLTLATFDGRVSSVTQVLHVRERKAQLAAD
jgi:PKD repeat protein